MSLRLTLAPGATFTPRWGSVRTIRQNAAPNGAPMAESEAAARIRAVLGLPRQ